MNRIPPAALLLALAGLIPFLWGALLVLGLTSGADWSLPAVLTGDGRLLMVRYGGIILPFMAGVLWGFATRADCHRGLCAFGASGAVVVFHARHRRRKRTDQSGDRFYRRAAA